MSDKSIDINKTQKAELTITTPILRYVIGSCFIVAVSSLMDYSLAYLTAVLGLGYLAPGVKPLNLKQSVGFILTLVVFNVMAFIFSAFFLDYLLIFIPLLALGILWLYYTDKLVGMVKIFAIMSIVLIPLLSLTHLILGAFVVVSLVNNAIMAIVLTQIIFLVFPWSEQDETLVKNKPAPPIQSEKQRFAYALNILIILFPVILVFYFFNLIEFSLVLIFVAILCSSPALANKKVGLIFIIANIAGGLFAILVYQLLTIVPMFVFMLMLILVVGFLFGAQFFSTSKLAPVFGPAYSTFLLILGNVTSSDSEAGETLWTRVILISVAVIYVVIAFAVLSAFQKPKKQTI